MSNTYSPVIPSDKSGNPKTGYPPAMVSLAATYRDTAAVSSILLLTHNTTEIEVSSSTGSTIGIAGKWISRANLDASVAGTSVITGLTTGNWDFVVPNGWVMRFVVPTATSANYASVQGVNRQEGLFPAVAFKTITGAGSVLTSEY